MTHPHVATLIIYDDGYLFVDGILVAEVYNSKWRDDDVFFHDNRNRLVFKNFDKIVDEDGEECEDGSASLEEVLNVLTKREEELLGIHP